MRALIVGAGAIGRYIAAQLALAGHDAVLLAKPDAATQLRDGYLLGIGDKVQRVIVPLVLGQDDGAVGEFDLVVTAVKSFATAGAIDSIRGLRACDRAAILVLQNGLGNEELCAAAFGDDRVVAGALTTAVETTPEGVVAAKKGGLTIAPVGALAHNWIIAAFEVSGIKVAAAPDWRALKWSKLCMNLLANAVCAILDWTPAQVYADKTAFDIERRCLLETIATMDKLGLTPIALIDFPVPLLVAAARLLPPGVCAWRLRLASRERVETNCRRCSSTRAPAARKPKSMRLTAPSRSALPRAGSARRRTRQSHVFWTASPPARFRGMTFAPSHPHSAQPSVWVHERAEAVQKTAQQRV